MLFSGECTCDTYWSKYDNKESVTRFNLPYTHPKHWTKLQLMPVLHVHTVELHMLEWTSADQNKNLNKNCTIIICIQLPKLCITWSLHVRKISRIIRESPRYSTNLLVSHMCHQISWSTLRSELFCALVWNLAHLFPPKIQNILWFKVSFWDIFTLVSSVIEVIFPKQILMVCSLCKTSYNIISHTHAITCGIGQFVRLFQSQQSILKRGGGAHLPLSYAYASKYPWLF